MRTYTEQFLDENRMELENRINNLVWTICGDYSLEIRPDAERFKKSRDAALLEGIRQGGLAKYFDRDAVLLYLVKKIYRHASEKPLMTVTQICIDRAVLGKLEKERKGVRSIQHHAYEDILEHEFHSLGNSMGLFRNAAMRKELDGEFTGVAKIQNWLELLDPLDESVDTDLLIRIIDRLYNSIAEPDFEQNRGTLEQVLAVTLEELTEFSWKDFLDEAASESSLEVMLEKISEEMTGLNLGEQDSDPEQEKTAKARTVVVDQAALDQMYVFVQKNFGRTFLKPMEEKQLNYQLCRGIHAGCHVYFTEGILKDPVMHNSQYEIYKKQERKNLGEYQRLYPLIKNNIQILSRTLKKALVLREEEERIQSEYGQIIPSRLWNVGRTDENKLFDRVIRHDDTDFAVDILIDASGSQRVRQTQVVLQAYILAETLSELKIPFRVMSFCTFWDYTVLQRYREYGDDRRENNNLFGFMTSSNNRDGLAIRAAANGLLQREESHKIMIILSDGKPNDLLVRQTGTERTASYEGTEAVKDTASEVRLLRRLGVSVLGVFVGNEEELSAERKIFGKDFAYIRSIETFANVVGRYLLKQIEE
ncbi:MAG: nitric oxide reductase activation protein [Lachnospiraceae bacterium]|nr:nitric oxide reductase activation protein [Lachnospiraceae bacterium]